MDMYMSMYTLLLIKLFSREGDNIGTTNTLDWSLHSVVTGELHALQIQMVLVNCMNCLLVDS